MPLSDQEELEFLTLQRQRSGIKDQPAQPSNIEQFAAKGPLGFLASKISGGTEETQRMLERAAYESGAKTTDLAAKAGLSPEVSGALGFAHNVGMQALPTLMGGGLGGAAAKVPLQAGARWLMGTAVKPSTTLTLPQRDQAIETMLKEGINVSRGGLEKIQTKLRELDDALEKIIANSTQKVDVTVAANTVRDLIQKKLMQVNNQSDLNAIFKSVDEFLNSAPVTWYKTGDMPIQVAQKLKRGTYESLGSKAYGEMGSTSEEAQKTLARGLKEEIARLEPGVAPINERMSGLQQAADALGTRIAAEGNKNPGGLSWIARTPEAALGFLMDRNAWIRSLAARGMYSGAGPVGTAAGAATGGLEGMREGAAGGPAPAGRPNMMDIRLQRGALPAEDPRQAQLAPLEHEAFAREYTQEHPIAGPLALGVLTPAYAAAKAAGATSGRTEPSLEQVLAGYRGIGQGLSER